MQMSRDPFSLFIDSREYYTAYPVTVFLLTSAVELNTIYVEGLDSRPSLRDFHVIPNLPPINRLLSGVPGGLFVFSVRIVRTVEPW